MKSREKEDGVIMRNKNIDERCESKVDKNLSMKNRMRNEEYIKYNNNRIKK